MIKKERKRFCSKKVKALFPEKIKQKNKKKVPSLSMDFIIKSKEEKYGNEKLCFCKNFI